MYLCIDVGNSRTKATVFDDQGLGLETIVFAGTSIEPIIALHNLHYVKHVIVATTGDRQWDLTSLSFEGLGISLSPDTPLPIEIVYSTPHTLGEDRIAGACGAHAAFPGKNCMIVSAGTCLTIDLINKHGIYLGGNISPGMAMRLQSMHDYTAKLPLTEPAWPRLPFGDSTVHALQNGACLGMVMEIRGMLNQAENVLGDVFVVMTGGNAAFLADRLESEIFVAPELVTQGLFQILEFNVRKHN